jgi:hypothetical protein
LSSTLQDMYLLAFLLLSRLHIRFFILLSRLITLLLPFPASFSPSSSPSFQYTLSHSSKGLLSSQACSPLTPLLVLRLRWCYSHLRRLARLLGYIRLIRSVATQALVLTDFGHSRERRVLRQRLLIPRCVRCVGCSYSARQLHCSPPDITRRSR